MHRQDDDYVPCTYRTLDDQVQRAAAALLHRGLAPGDRVGIFSYNRPEWAIADLAIHAMGGVVVPIYHTLTAETIRYILRDSGMKLLFVENDELLARVLAARDGAPDLAHVVRFEGRDMDTFLGDDGPPSEAIVPDTGSEDVATIVYTSGTTGEPKGVMLTHGNILSQVEALRDRYSVTVDDVYVSYLPLAHMFERSGGHFVMLLSGATIAYARGVNTVVEDIQAARPTILAAVPRAIEKAYDTVVEKVGKGSRFQQALVQKTIQCLNEYANRQHRGQKIPLRLRAQCAVLNSFVASKFRGIVGDRARLIVSGGAPLDRKLAKVLLVLGFKILEGYGLTETSPTVASMTLDDIELGTVGTPLPGVDVKIGAHDEILVRGPNVMKGYFRKPEATAEAIDADGFFHTGDRGRFDEKGHLIITGRLKDLIVTSYGKNVAPTPLEAELARHPLVQQAMVCGDNRKYLTALLVPEPRAVAELEAPEIREHFEALVEEMNADLPNYEKIRRFSLLTEEPTVENGLLTPTLKLRRAKVVERYADRIEKMYGP